MTAAKSIAAAPDWVAGKPLIVQGAGMLNGLVYGVDDDGKWYFNGSGERPPERTDATKKDEDK